MRIWKERFSRLSKNWLALLGLTAKAVICLQQLTLVLDQTYKVVKYTMNNNLHKVWVLNKILDKCSNKISSLLSLSGFVTNIKRAQSNLYTGMEGPQPLSELARMHDLVLIAQVHMALT